MLSVPTDSNTSTSKIYVKDCTEENFYGYWGHREYEAEAERSSFSRQEWEGFDGDFALAWIAVKSGTPLWQRSW